MAATANVDAPEGANTKFATVGGQFESDSRLSEYTMQYYCTVFLCCYNSIFEVKLIHAIYKYKK